MATTVNWSAIVTQASKHTGHTDPAVRDLALAITALAKELTRQGVQGA